RHDGVFASVPPSLTSRGKPTGSAGYLQARRDEALEETAEEVNRPSLEVADIFRAAGRDFIEKSRRWLTWQHLKVLRAIEHCRTAALGGHVDACSQCGHHAISFNSCRNRHCPKCQTNARNKWLKLRADELLPVRY